MWYVVVNANKARVIYASKPPISEGTVVDGFEEYSDAVKAARETEVLLAADKTGHA
jgi:hypothetical protein